MLILDLAYLDAALRRIPVLASGLFAVIRSCSVLLHAGRFLAFYDALSGPTIHGARKTEPPLQDIVGIILIFDPYVQSTLCILFRLFQLFWLLQTFPPRRPLDS